MIWLPLVLQRPRWDNSFDSLQLWLHSGVVVTAVRLNHLHRRDSRNTSGGCKCARIQIPLVLRKTSENKLCCFRLLLNSMMIAYVRQRFGDARMSHLKFLPPQPPVRFAWRWTSRFEFPPNIFFFRLNTFPPPRRIKTILNSPNKDFPASIKVSVA